MTSTSSSKPPIWYWIVSVIALIWNAMGVIQYLGQAYNTDAFREQYTAEQLELMANTPSWVTAAFALAVFGGIVGAIALLLRKKWAYHLFLISLLAVTAQMIYNLFVIDSIAIYGPGAAAMTAMIILFALLLLWFSKKAISKGWIS
ncbi:hypothetical protein NA63_2322 [Flavobacteriaceae bacterium MAR_2010_105]|nr:hypothetical protein NA63_2322 [Flavobacteriaceae bacterium MAR_2010_105]